MAYDFDKVAHGYDRMNHLMTLGLDKWWRKRAAKELSALRSPLSVLDVACGTGDMAVALLGLGATVTGIDLSEAMLNIAKQKTASASACLTPPTFLLGDAEALPFPDGSFDAVTCAFGVRNFVHLEKGLGEMLRVLKPGGRLLILELATPDSRILNVFYNIYARRVIPWLGSWLAGSREAYTYLPASIERFPKGEGFLRILQGARFKIQHPIERKFTFGVCRLYEAVRL